MDCKEFEKLIPDFIDRKMDFATLKSFNEHMKQCENCEEELVIQFLITEGIQSLEEGDSFDLKKELNERLQSSRKKMRLQNIALYAIGTIEVLIIIALAIFILWMVLS